MKDVSKHVTECSPKWRGMCGVYSTSLAYKAYSKIKMSEWTIRACHSEVCDCGDNRIENRCRHQECRAWGMFEAKINGEYISLCPTCNAELIKRLKVKVPKRRIGKKK